MNRVVAQNRRLLENWEAERAHLEANRARAEEVYKEEREIMDEERIIWTEEKTRLEDELLEWRKRTEVAESELDNSRKEVEALRKQCEIYRKFASSSQSGRASSSLVGTPAATGSGSSGSPGDRAAPVKFRNYTNAPSPLSGRPFSGRGTTMPESKPFEPLDPRMQSASSAVVAQDAKKDQVLCVHISEVIPGLEGIRVKKLALERSTFTDEKMSSSTSDDDDSPDSKPRSSQTRLTKQALEAPEISRLTMHAGHTPNHSISLSAIQTAESTLAPNTADSSGAATPTQESTEPDLSSGRHTEGGDSAPIPEDTHDDEELGHLEPSEGDRPLQGPLQLRNRPASDEPFLRKLSDKLEDSIRSNDTTPTVLRTADAVLPPLQSPSQEAADGGADESGDLIEEDIPLKRKQLCELAYYSL